MPGVSVSIDALTRVKAALNDYQIDISGFSQRIEQQSADIMKSAEREMQKIAQQIEETRSAIWQLKEKIIRLEEDIKRMGNDIKATERKIEATENRIGAKQKEADCIREQIAELERAAANAQGEAAVRIREQLSELRELLAQVEAEIRGLRNELSDLKARITQLQQGIRDARSERVKAEDKLHAAERVLDRRQNKHERMKATVIKLNDQMEAILSASKSFETRATSKAEESAGNIDKCLAAIEAYLA
ncbi:MAG: hypothetical protein LBI54_00885 [Lachnospiraceae bacterium]|jgi:chromosome segregation ATPase|nr:hypothetical protein [Lachnospiraceae bacterium]